MKLNIPGVYEKRKPLKSGYIKTYYYHRATGKRLPDDPLSQEFHEMRKRLDGRPIGIAPAGRTFMDLKLEYLAATDFTDLRESTQSEYRRHISYLEEVLGPFAVAAIQPIHAEKLMQKYAKRPTLAKAIRRTLSKMVSFAVITMKWLPQNPLILPKGRGGKPAPQTGQKPYEEHELRAFRLANPLGTRARLAFEIALGTALRREDLPRVRVADLMQSTFGIIAGKNGETIVFAVTKMMREACLAYVAAREAVGLPASKFALCSEKGTKLHKRTVSSDMEAAFEAAGFDENQRIHALRYTAATRLLEANFSYEAIQKLTGHRMAEMAKHYTRQSRESPIVAETFDAMDALSESPAQTVNEQPPTSTTKAYRISSRVVPVTNEELEQTPHIVQRPTKPAPTRRRARNTVGRPEPGR